MKVVRTAAVAGFKETVESLGGDFQSICDKSTIPTETFNKENYDKYISLDKLSELLTNAAIATNCYHIGLILGLGKDASSLGILGLMVNDAPDVCTALDTLAQNTHIHAQESINSSFTFDKKFAVLCLDPNQPAGKINHHVSDLILGCTYGLLKSLCGDGFKPSEVHLGARAYNSENKYSRLFAATTKINQPHNEIVFPASYLSIKLDGIDPQYNMLLKEYVAKDEENLSFSIRTKNILQNILAKPECNIEYVAEQFSLNKRTLNRRLALEGTSFKEILNKTKQDEALQLLSNTNNTITQIALELGYSEASSFTNAFKKWLGITPKKWQQKNC